MQSHDCIPLHAAMPGSDARRDLPTSQFADATLMGLYLGPITEKVPTDAVSGLPPHCHHFFLFFFLKIFIWLCWLLVVLCGIFHYDVWVQKLRYVGLVPLQHAGS